MYQGNIGYFINETTGEGKWLWKVRPAQSITPVYYDLMTGEDVDSGTVTDSLNDGNRKNLVIEQELDASEAIMYLKFNPPDIDRVVRKRSIESLLQQKASIKSKLQQIDDEVKVHMDYVGRLSEDKGRLRQAYWETCCKLDEYPEDARTLYLVHASHTAADGADYCWWADKALADTLRPGDTILCETSRGDQLAIVREIEECAEWEPHKRVIKKVSN